MRRRASMTSRPDRGSRPALIRRDCDSMGPREQPAGFAAASAASPKAPWRGSGRRHRSPTPPPRIARACAVEIETLIEELSALANSLHQREVARRRAESLGLPGRGHGPASGPGSDPVVGPAVARLTNAMTGLGCRTGIVAYGSASTLMQPLRGPVSEILSALVQDIAAAAASEPDVATTEGRVRDARRSGTCAHPYRDNGPRSGSAGAVSDADRPLHALRAAPGAQRTRADRRSDPRRASRESRSTLRGGRAAGSGPPRLHRAADRRQPGRGAGGALRAHRARGRAPLRDRRGRRERPAARTQCADRRAGRVRPRSDPIEWFEPVPRRHRRGRKAHGDVVREAAA